MVYWDASALVPLCVEESNTAELRRLVKDSSIVTSVLSRVEITSAIERRSRESALDSESRIRALSSLAELADAWTEIHAIAAVSERATRLLASHALRSADALQLAAAMVAAGEQPRGHSFVCTDRRSRDAASREGFRVLP